MDSITNAEVIGQVKASGATNSPEDAEELSIFASRMCKLFRPQQIQQFQSSLEPTVSNSPFKVQCLIRSFILRQSS